MKNILVILLISISVNIFGQSDTLSSLFRTANTQYTNKEYAAAAKNYESIIASGYESAALYYNLGSSYFKQNEIAKSILNYERALKLSPKNNDIIHNLEYANTLVKDEFGTVPDFILDKIWKRIISLFSSNIWSLVSINMFILALSIFLLFLFSKSRKRRKLSFFLSIFLMIFTVITFSFAVISKNNITNSNAAIVMQITTVKSSPEEQGTDLYIINPGVKVKIKSNNNNWVEVELPNGQIGWIKDTSIDII